MNELYDLKKMLMKELENYGSKGELSAGTLEIVDKLTHTLKNLCKIIEDTEESDYSGNYPMNYDRSYRGSYRDGSYAGRRYARRDSMGRYSGERGYSRAGLADELRGLMADAPDDHTRQEIKRLADKLDDM